MMAGVASDSALVSSPVRGDETLTERAASLIERDILAGRLAPGLRLAVQTLSAAYAIGTTPVREGLSRLVARGIVTAIGQRGFRVADVSRADLEDITRVRVMVETEALAASMARGDDAWEVGIVAALHHLRLCLDRSPDGLPEGSEAFDRCHKAFHRALIAGCGSERLLALHDDLYFQAYRYRRVMMNRLGEPQRFLATHQALADLVLARQGEVATASLARHLRQTVETVYGDTVEVIE